MLRLTGRHLLLPVAFSLAACGYTNAYSIRDYMTMRTVDGQALSGRDIAPSPMPREAIRSDDYFGIKLEHIFLGPSDDQRARNIGLIAEVSGIVPDGINCDELPMSEIDIDLPAQRTDNALKSNECSYRTIVDLKTNFNGSHLTYDSTFITPVFRTANEPLSFRFLMVNIRDMALARRIADWALGQVDGLMNRLGGAVNPIAREIVSVGVSAVNLILDMAAEPTYVFQMTTDFVAAESVADTTTPQNLLVAGDYIIVGVREGGTLLSAMVAAEELYFNSGRLYWTADDSEYRDAAYMVFKVVRFSRYPGQLPISLEEISRASRRGDDATPLVRDAQQRIVDLQELSILNETEGDLLRVVLDWYGDAARTDAALQAAADARPPMQIDYTTAFTDGTLALDPLLDAHDLTRRLQERVYDGYGASLGFRQSECIALGAMSRSLAEEYATVRAPVVRAFEEMQIRRVQLQRSTARSAEQQAEFDAIVSLEPLVAERIGSLPDSLPEPVCPGLREPLPGE
jgi:hypothetical protein